MRPALDTPALDTPAIAELPTVQVMRIPTATLEIPFPLMLSLKSILAARLVDLDRVNAPEVRTIALRTIYDEVCLAVGAEPGVI